MWMWYKCVNVNVLNSLQKPQYALYEPGCAVCQLSTDESFTVLGFTQMFRLPLSSPSITFVMLLWTHFHRNHLYSDIEESVNVSFPWNQMVTCHSWTDMQGATMKLFLSVHVQIMTACEILHTFNTIMSSSPLFIHSSLVAWQQTRPEKIFSSFQVNFPLSQWLLTLIETGLLCIPPSSLQLLVVCPMPQRILYLYPASVIMSM